MRRIASQLTLNGSHLVAFTLPSTLPQVPSNPEVADASSWVKVFSVQSVTQWPLGVAGGNGPVGDYVQAVMSICAPPLFALVRRG